MPTRADTWKEGPCVGLGKDDQTKKVTDGPLLKRNLVAHATCRRAGGGGGGGGSGPSAPGGSGAQDRTGRGTGGVTFLTNGVEPFRLSVCQSHSLSVNRCLEDCGR